VLPRVLEPEAMDTQDEARDYDAMDHAEVNARFVADFLAAHGPCRGGTVLDVGTGPARIPIALCRADANARVVAIDLASHMLRLAQRNVTEAGFASRILLQQADAKAFPYPAGTFEAVVSNTIVHHIPDPEPVLAALVRQVAAGGTLFVRDLVRPDHLDDLERIVGLYAGTESPAARGLFAASLHAALTVAEVRAMVVSAGLPADSVTMTSDRHWTCVWPLGEARCAPAI
jgi:ubiquinone/menaquinone biosynthesis C-methylase UbiE